MPRLLRTRLSAMMFLFYFALGSWIVTLPTYLLSAPIKGGLNFTTNEVGWVSSTFAIGAMAAQLFVGLLADRLFRAERVLAVACLGCAGTLAAAGWWCESRFPVVEAAYRAAAGREVRTDRPLHEHIAAVDAAAAALPPMVAEPLREQTRRALDRARDDPAVRAAAADTFRLLFWIMLAQCFAAHLGVTLSTVIALRNLPDPSAGFARTRLWGTVGWVVAGNAIGFFLTAVSAEPLYLAAGSATVAGVYAFTLPPTPPKGHGKSLAEAFGLPALRLLRDRPFAVFLAAAFVGAVLNQFYVVFGHRCLTDYGVPRPEQVMTLAQVVEVGCMYVIPLLRPKDWMKPLMAVGVAGWVLRAAAMAAESRDLAVLVGVPMHGWSYAFFSVVAATFIDREAPPHLRASAQAVVSFVAAGVGPWTGNLLAAAVVDANRHGTVIDWGPVWQVPLVGGLLLLVAFAALFRPPRERPIN